MRARNIVVIVFLLAAVLSILISSFNVYDNLDFQYSYEVGYEQGMFNWNEFTIQNENSSFFYSIKSSNFEIGLVIAKFNSSVHTYTPTQSDIILNVTGTEISGRYDTTSEGFYSLVIYGVDPPGTVISHVDFEISRIPSSTLSSISNYTILICVLAASTAILPALGWKSEKRKVAEIKDVKTITVWQHLIMNIGNWIAIPIGAVIISIISIVRSITILNSYGAPYLQTANSIGLLLILWGIVFGAAFIIVRTIRPESILLKSNLLRNRILAMRESLKVDRNTALGIVGVILLIVGTFLPWETSSSPGGNLMGGATYWSGSGWTNYGVFDNEYLLMEIALILSIIGVSMIAVKQRMTEAAGLAIGVSVSAIFLYTYANVDHSAYLVNSQHVADITAYTGYGIWVSIIGSLLLVIGGLLSFIKTQKVTSTGSTI
jgi:hypothetical protein